MHMHVSTPNLLLNILLLTCLLLCRTLPGADGAFVGPQDELVVSAGWLLSWPHMHLHLLSSQVAGEQHALQAGTAARLTHPSSHLHFPPQVVLSNSGRSVSVYEGGKLAGSSGGATKPLYSAELKEGLMAAVYPGGWGWVEG